MAKCLQLGLVMRQAPSYTITHPALTLRPLAVQHEVLDGLFHRQRLWNEAVDRMARNFTFLQETMQSTADSDVAFTGRLLQMLVEVYMTPAPGASQPIFQPLMLGIFRTDYMRAVSQSQSIAAAEEEEKEVEEREELQQWKNVEINTISCSFAGLSPLVQQFHRYLQQYQAVYRHDGIADATTTPIEGLSSHQRGTIAPSESMEKVPASLAAAVEAWQFSTHWDKASATLRGHAEGQHGVPLKPVVLVIIQEGERNTADQYNLLLQLLETYGVLSIRRTLTQIHSTLRLQTVEGGETEGEEKCHTDASSALASQAPFAILEEKYAVALAYFRSTYVPDDFISEETWVARELLERCNAIKCPSIPYHLMTFKKMQQAMTNMEEVLIPISFSGDAAKAEALAEHFMPQYSLNAAEYANGSSQHRRNDDGEIVTDPEVWIRDAIQHPHRYVLKPQLEGGGNLIAGAEMQAMLRDTDPTDPLYSELRREYILMRRIQFPIQDGIFFRHGAVHILQKQACSELGVYGVLLSSGEYDAGKATPLLMSEAAGYVVRTKPSDNDDGGVMAGVACLDCVVYK